MAPSLSVVVCTLAGPAEPTVESIRAAAGGDAVEIVVVWQGSADPPELAGATVVDVFPLGLSHARNRGLAAVRRPLVAFVDDDELVDPGWIRGIHAGFASPDVSGVFGPVEPLDDRGLPYCTFTAGEPRIFSGPATPPWIVGTGGNMTFRREALAGVGGFDLRFGAGAPAHAAEETDLILRLLTAGHTLAWSPEMVVYHPTKDASKHLASRFPYGFGMASALRRNRAGTHIGRYLVTIGQSFATGVRGGDARRRREALATLRAFAAGLASRPRFVSPAGALDRAPGELRAELDGQAVRPLHGDLRGRPHLRYAVEPDRVLHVFVGPEPAPPLEAEVLAASSGRDAAWLLARR